MDPKPICPRCGESSQVEKVSSLYLVGLEMRRKRRPPHGEALVNETNLISQLAASPSLTAASKKLAPPSSGKQVLVRPIHPDQAVAVFSLIAPFFLYKIFNTDKNAALVVAVILVLLYGVYFWQRKKLVSRFEAERSRQRQADVRTRQAIQRWMELYYCAGDDWVFDPSEGEGVTADQLMGYLYRE